MRHFVRFISIGGISTLLQFALLALLVEFKLAPEVFKLAPEVVASATSYVLSSIFNYMANYHFTFASNNSHATTLPKFAVTVGLGLSVSTLLFAIFLHLFGHYMLAQFLATGITVCLNFLVHKLWIYKGH